MLFVPLAGVSVLPANVVPERIASLLGGTGGHLFEGDSPWGLSPDGRTIVAVRDVISPAGSLELVVNWFDELRRLVPVR